MDNHQPDAASSAKSLVIVKNIYKSFNSAKTKIDILKGVNLTIKKGETIAVVGESGIGKSTFLHILGTLEMPNSGSLFFKGDDVLLFDKTTLAKFRNSSIGFVFQFHHLLSEFSAIENVMMPALIRGKSKEKAKKSAEEILLKVGLRDRLFHKAGKLSGGEQQRVALARALVLGPDILLADEPTGNLDKKNSEQIHSIFMELNQDLNMTMVIVTHNPNLALYMTRHITIANGQLVETD